MPRLPEKQTLIHGTIKSWYDKQRKGQALLIDNKKKTCKFSHSTKKAVLDYYFEHGRNASKAAKHFGYPARTTLIECIKKDHRFKNLKPRRIRKIPVIVSDEIKKNVVIELATTKGPVK